MVLTKEYISKAKDKLKAVGWVDQNSKDFDYYISKKHYSRLVKLINWMKSNSLPTNERDVNNAYRADVVVRGMLKDILKPLELEIIAHICYLLDIEEIGFDSLIDASFYNEFDMENYIIYTKQYKTMEWFIEAISKISAKYKTMDLNIIFTKMTLGQISGFIDILNKEYLIKLFEDKGTIKEIRATVRKLVSLRNHLAHHDIIFSLDGVKHNSRPIEFSEFIDTLHLLANNDYKSELKSKIERYRDNTIRKYSEETNFVKINVENLFQAIISTLISV